MEAPNGQVTCLGKQQQADGRPKTLQKSPILTKKNLQRQELLCRMKITPNNTSQEGTGRLKASQTIRTDMEPMGKVSSVSLKDKYKLGPKRHSHTCDLHPKHYAMNSCWQLRSLSILVCLLVVLFKWISVSSVTVRLYHSFYVSIPQQ